jgi:hypothetical protein
MKVTGQPHALPAVRPGKGSRVPTEQEQTPEAVWTFRRRKICFTLAGFRTRIFQTVAHSLYGLRYPTSMCFGIDVECSVDLLSTHVLYVHALPVWVMHLQQTSSCVTVPASSSLFFCALISKYCLTQSNELVWSRGVYALVKCLLQVLTLYKRMFKWHYSAHIIFSVWPRILYIMQVTATHTLINGLKYIYIYIVRLLF